MSKSFTLIKIWQDLSSSDLYNFQPLFCKGNVEELQGTGKLLIAFCFIDQKMHATSDLP